MPRSQKKNDLATLKPDPSRIHQVYQWILAGQCERDIREAIAKEWPNADPAPLLVSAMTKLAEAGQFDKQIVSGWCMEAYREMYRRMLEVGDFSGAMRCIHHISELAGV